ncbi:MAG: 2-oxoacid:acceptor oxidoreductase family protein, partial [Clostridia bacterium]|nr:2-oxoacid:acceptor oxidoreductase family protein [Clostridia bacterium]
IKERGKHPVVINGLQIACDAGNSKAVNVVMIGALCSLIGIEYEIALEAVRRCVPQKLLEVNERALNMGYKYR